MYHLSNILKWIKFVEQIGVLVLNNLSIFYDGWYDILYYKQTLFPFCYLMCIDIKYMNNFFKEILNCAYVVYLYIVRKIILFVKKIEIKRIKYFWLFNYWYFFGWDFPIRTGTNHSNISFHVIFSFFFLFSRFKTFKKTFLRWQIVY